MKLSFNGLEELRAFLAEIDGDGSDDAAEGATGTTRRRRGPNKPKDGAPAANPGFAPPPTQQSAAGFPGAASGFAPPPPQPQVNPLVGQIITMAEQAMTAGQPQDAVVGWFRTALGPEAAQANWEQIKAAYLPKASETLLKDIAKPLGVKF